MDNNSFRKFNQNATKIDLASIELLQRSHQLPTTDNPQRPAEDHESFFFELPDFRTTTEVPETASDRLIDGNEPSKAATVHLEDVEQTGSNVPAPVGSSPQVGVTPGVFEYRELATEATSAATGGFELYAQFDLQRSVNENNQHASAVQSEGRFERQQVPVAKSLVEQSPYADVPEHATEWATDRPEIGTVRTTRTSPPTSSPTAGPAKSTNATVETAKLMGVATTSFYEQSPALIQRLLQRQEKMGCPIVLISDVDQPLRAADICVKLAFELAHQSGKRVLVIDADTENQLLSQHAGLPALTTGLTDIFRGECLMEGTIRPTENPAVAFLCNGKRALNFRLAHASIETIGQRVIGAARQSFDFVCVTTGTAFDGSLALWGRYCDVTFVTLDPTRTSRTLAKAAVGELQRAGARIEGCITVFDKQVA